MLTLKHDNATITQYTTFEMLSQLTGAGEFWDNTAAFTTVDDNERGI